MSPAGAGDGACLGWNRKVTGREYDARLDFVVALRQFSSRSSFFHGHWLRAASAPLSNTVCTMTDPMYLQQSARLDAAVLRLRSLPEQNRLQFIDAFAEEIVRPFTVHSTLSSFPSHFYLSALRQSLMISRA